MIRINCFLLAGSLTLSLCVAGCDDQVAATAKSHAALQEAVDLLDEAEQGYVGPEAGADYNAFRMDKLREARTQLETLVAEGNNAATKAGAHRLLAGVKLSQARAATDRAVTGFARLNGHSIGVFDHLAAAQRINALIVARGGDGGAVLKALEEGQELVRDSKAGINSSLSELSAQRESATLKAEQLNGEASSHFTRAQEFEEQSRVAPNDEVKRDVFTKAYSAQLKGQASQRLAQEQQIEANQLADQIAALRSQLELWDKMGVQVSTLKQRVQMEGDEAARDVSTAGSRKDLALTTISGEVQTLTRHFNDNVDGPLNAAASEAESAVAELEKAKGLASASEKSALEFEQAAARVELAHILSRHASFTADFGKMLDAIVQNPNVAGSSTASEYRSQPAELADRAAALVDRAKDVIEAGLAQTESMAGDTATGQASQALAQALRTYGDQLN